MAEYLVNKKADLISALYGVNLQRFHVVDYIIQGDENTNSFSIKSNNFVYYTASQKHESMNLAYSMHLN